MYNYNPVTKTEGDFLIVGRGASAIYVLLACLNRKNGKVIIPANICYAAVYPVIYAGYIPVFCDVDKYSGNITYDTLSEAYRNTEDVIAVITPHMYGNPIKDMLKIKDFCKEDDVLLIEDCASMMGGCADGYAPGTVGDYTIYSTGYSKTLDNGIGGILYSRNHDLSEIAEFAEKLPLFDPEYENIWTILSKIYRILRNEGQFVELSQQIYKIMPDAVRKSLVFTLDNKACDDLYKKIDKLDVIIEKRRHDLEIYKEELKNIGLEIYIFEKGAVPWRFNFYMEPADRKKFIAYCLNHAIPVSDWYPCVTPMFGDNNVYEAAKWHEDRILNFPLMKEEEEILHICSTVRDYFK